MSISFKQARALGIDVGKSVVAKLPTVTSSSPATPVGRLVQSMWVERWLPRSLNKMLGHYMARSRQKKEDRKRLAFEAMIQGIVRATGRRRVDLLVILPPKVRRIDKDNARKSLNDGLTHCGAILGDSPNLLAEGCVSFSRAEVLAGEEPTWGTVIVLTDME